jgi:hypothetical protein
MGTPDAEMTRKLGEYLRAVCDSLPQTDNAALLESLGAARYRENRGSTGVMRANADSPMRRLLEAEMDAWAHT